MSDIQTMKQMISGLQQKKKNLQADEAIFLKLSGINEEIEKALQDKQGHESGLIEAKKKRDDAKLKKLGVVSKTSEEIEKKLNEAIPCGKGIFRFEQDNEDSPPKIKIGWVENGKYTPYNGMSGMQGKVFDTALAHVLDADIIVLEAAELDQENLEKTLIELSKLDKQVLVSTCHSLDGLKIPENFVVVGV
jgi:hypothetical protein